MIKPVLPILIYLLCFNQYAAAQSQSADLERQEELAFKQAAALASPSVVRVQTVGGVDRIGNVLTATGPTTGVVVSKDGYIISSAFNFAAKPVSILVELPDQRRLPAKLVARDHLKMLTLLKVEANDLSPAKPVAKKSLRTGQWSLALGRTYDGVLPSISVGIVSALNRVNGNAIQTDAKVSPVNYGGPLIDIQGNVMGILVPLSPQGNGETAGVEWYDSGIGFAIPIADVYDNLEKLKQGKDLHRGLMGVSFQGRDKLSGKPLINLVRVNSPAYDAGIKRGDQIVKIDQTEIDRQAEVFMAMGNKYAGDVIEVTLKRGQETLTKKVTLVDQLVPYEAAALGLLPMRFPNKKNAKVATKPGVTIRYLFAESPAVQAGLQRLDRIVKINDQAITDTDSLRTALTRYEPGDTVTLEYLRDEKPASTELKLMAESGDVPLDLRSTTIPAADADDNKADDADDKPQQSKTGRFTHELPEHEHEYWAYVPEDYNPNYAYGLMVWLHPNGDTMEAAIFDDWKAVCSRRGIIIIAPKADDISGWKPNEAVFVKAAIEDIQEKYSIDKGRVFLHGHSEGGIFAYHVAFKYRELFKGVAVSAARLKARPPENDPEYPLLIYITCGTEDNRFQAVNKNVTGLRNMKFPVQFTPLPALEHVYPPSEIVNEIATWADALDRL